MEGDKGDLDEQQKQLGTMISETAYPDLKKSTSA